MLAIYAHHVPLDPPGRCAECGADTDQPGICDDCYRDEYGCRTCGSIDAAICACNRPVS